MHLLAQVEGLTVFAGQYWCLLVIYNIKVEVNI